MINLKKNYATVADGFRTRGRGLVCAILLTAGLTLIPPLRAIEMTPLAIEELSQRAQLVVQGKVLSKTCQADAAGRIFTIVELEVAEVWKGDAQPGRLNIFHGGGALGDRRSVVSGQVEYNIGEEMVAFLVRNARGEAITVGLAQGKFRVWTDARTGEKLARNPFHGGEAARSTPARAARSGAASPAGADRLPLARLKQQVQGGAR